MQPRHSSHAHDGSGATEDTVPAIERICDDIAGRIQYMARELERHQKNAINLVRNVADGKGLCSGPNCGKEFLWVVHKNGRRTPYDFDGTPHFVTCPDRDLFQQHRGGNYGR